MSIGPSLFFRMQNTTETVSFSWLADLLHTLAWDRAEFVLSIAVFGTAKGNVASVYRLHFDNQFLSCCLTETPTDSLMNVEPNNPPGSVQYTRSFGVLGYKVSVIRAGTQRSVIQESVAFPSFFFSGFQSGKLTESHPSSVWLKGKPDLACWRKSILAVSI